MSHLSSRRFLTVVGSLLLMLVFVVATRRVDAQGAPGSIATIMAALAELQSTVEQLLPGDPKIHRYTPPVFADIGELPACRFINVSNEPRTINIALSGKYVLDESPATLVFGPREVGPGETDEVLAAGITAKANMICRFTVVNGTADDIRASIGIKNAPLGVERISLPAE